MKQYDFLIKIINKNLEANGFSKLDVKNKIDELYKTLADITSSDELITKLTELLITLMEVSLDSDKKELQNFIKDVVVFYNGDKDKIYEQLMSYIENIIEQSKLQTKSLNRTIRGFLKDSEEKLKQRLKEEDIPTDKIVSFEKFDEIINEAEVQLKEGHMDVLLYQMKKKVPKGKSFNTLNMIVVVDFLK